MIIDFGTHTVDTQVGMYDFWGDFLIAEHFGIDAVEDTFNRSFSAYTDTIDAMISLALTTNIRSWYWAIETRKLDPNATDYNQKLEAFNQLGSLYSSFYYKCYDHVYGDDTPFDEDERHKFFEYTD